MSINYFEIFIPGAPRSKQRPRVIVSRSNSKGKAWTYTPDITKEYAKYIRLMVKEAMGRNGFKPIPRGEPVSLFLGFYQHRKDTSRPDLSNLCNNICDAITGILFYDDSQITRLRAFKHKCCKGKDGVQLRVRAESQPSRSE